MDRKITVSIVGLGSRGNAYANCISKMSDKAEIVAIADIIDDKVKRFAKKFGVREDMCFDSAEALLEREKLSDILMICTMDKQHYGHAIPALKKGYHLLLEKPASPDPAECLEIAKTANELGREVVVCHVLRYAPFYKKLKEIMDTGVLGDVLCIQANEQVLYWHQAHSFVRGNWRNKEESSSMILQKCCHDMDILLWLTGKHCKSVSSFGELSHFKSEMAPAGAPERCTEECPEYFNCPYSVDNCYMKNARQGNFSWPLDVVTPEPSIDMLKENLRTGPYGRCVYHCDNNVVDHQVVNLQLEDDLTVSFNMCAFTSDGGRRIHIMGTKGDITAYMEDNQINLTIFGKETEIIKTETSADEFGHGGGDLELVKDLIRVFTDSGEKKATLTSINNSIESHIVALAAEESRVNGGELVKIDEFASRF